MSSFSRWQSQSSVLLAVGMAATTVVPFMVSSPASAATFTDVERGYWARPFIERLSDEGVIAGFNDGTFKPEQRVTRAQFAAMIRQAFSKNEVRQYRGFQDVASSYWATPAIQEAYETGFMSGYEGGLFRPNQQIPRVQVLVSLASGLQLSPRGSTNSALNVYSDAGDIPNYAVDKVAAATERQLVVNYPNLRFLNPNEEATRAEVAAFIYQALVNQGELQPIAGGASQYVVGYSATGTPNNSNNNNNNNNSNNNNNNNNNTTQDSRLRVADNTLIDVKYPGNQNFGIIVAPGQTLQTTLEVATDVRNSQNQILIPRGSQITGRLIPITIGTVPGTQFRADTLRVGNQTYTINASSNPVAATQNVTPQTVQRSVVTTGAGAILSSILGGGIDIGNLAGAILGGSQTPNTTTQTGVIAINPEQLDLRVDSEFYVTSTSR